VTHSITYLPEVDNIVVIKDGRISEVGTYKELLAQKGAFAEVLVQFLSQELEETADEDIPTELEMLRYQSPPNSLVFAKFCRSKFFFGIFKELCRSL